jgi:hypothetical protein
LQVFFALYNVLNTATAVGRSDVYTGSYVEPIVNGDPAELKHLKSSDGGIAKPNEAYGHPVAYQAPIFTRFGLRFNF